MTCLFKERNARIINYLNGAELVGNEMYPQIKPTQVLPVNMISISEFLARKDREKFGVDHFSPDEHFERIYNNFEKYLPYYRMAKCVIGTDFSAYRNMSRFERKYNVGRNRTMDYCFQKNGIDVVPVASYAYIEDFEWCMESLPHHSSIAISTNGSMMNFVSHDVFISGAIELQNTLQPTHLIICGGPVPELDELYDNIIYYKNYSQRLRERLHRG